MSTRIGDLDLVPQVNVGYSCPQLAGVLSVMEQQLGRNKLLAVIQHVISQLRKFVVGSSGNFKKFDEVVAALQVSVDTLTLGQQLVFWLGDWWYYHPELRGVTRPDMGGIVELCGETLAEHFVPALPQQVRNHLLSHTPMLSAVSNGHFALLFRSPADGKRQIVTDTQLIELHGVFGYIYLDISPCGTPVARSCCSPGGGRAFFDGMRLMAHRDFQTCAPRTVMIEGGYKVNSTGVTIINGAVYPTVDSDDALSQGTGADFLMGRFDGITDQDASRSHAILLARAGRLRVQDGVAFLDDKALTPRYSFKPSRVELLNTGFSLYHWAEIEQAAS